ncbi:hypothetical protein C0993_006480 [Termitomyces sp. T159_Od127]|nr:hypothetical protein C0993_006480 [Termitomyces sp. T159_Od127]
MTVAQLQDCGLNLVEWDGSTPHRLLDSEGLQIGILAGRPRADSWNHVIAEAELAMRTAQQDLGERWHAHGKFGLVNGGISFGGGEKKPGNFKPTPALRFKVLDHLLNIEAFRRIAGFGSSILQCYAPALYTYYMETLESLLDKDVSLRHNFATSVFAACTFNIGPCTVTHPYIDAKNLAWGFCAITALGNFNPDAGGHLVLWDLGLIIRFPPGSTILIQSAVLTHSNVPVIEGDERFSFTQYSAAGIFRWVHNHHQSDKDLLGSADEDKRLEFQSAKITRWAEGLTMLERFNK